MSNENLALWESVERTDPRHVKAITGKQYGGNSPKPHYLIHKATETFGPCGIGWGFSIADERIEEGAGGEKMHIARVKVWYEWNGKRGEVEHVGGTPFSGVRASGKAFNDEDAPKKSVTDALIKALSLIGFAGDIFMGRYDDSKYVNDLKREIADGEPEPKRPDSLLRDQLEGSIAIERAKKDTTPVEPHRPPYADELDRFRKGAEALESLAGYKQFVNDPYFNGIYQNLPVAGQAQAKQILAASRKRLGVVSTVEPEAA